MKIGGKVLEKTEEHTIMGTGRRDHSGKDMVNLEIKQSHIGKNFEMERSKMTAFSNPFIEI